MMLIGVVVHQVLERMVVPDPWCNHHTPVPLRSGLEEFLDPWRDLLVNLRGLSSRGGLEGQSEHPDGDGCGIQ